MNPGDVTHIPAAAREKQALRAIERGPLTFTQVVALFAIPAERLCELIAATGDNGRAYVEAMRGTAAIEARLIQARADGFVRYANTAAERAVCEAWEDECRAAGRVTIFQRDDGQLTVTFPKPVRPALRKQMYIGRLVNVHGATGTTWIGWASLENAIRVANRIHELNTDEEAFRRFRVVETVHEL
jgi:hypothetical protein